MNLFSRIELFKPKSQPITETMVTNAYKRINKSSKGRGIDNMSISEFEKDKSDNLYKIWNRMASGSYFPPAVKEVEIPKSGSNKTRTLGIATIGDRVAQNVVSHHLESLIDSQFEENSYAYRKGKSAQQALRKCKQNCWRYSWAVDIDIKGFFDNIDRDLLMKILREHTDEKWVSMYIERWIDAPIVKQDGTEVKREKGTPQGGVISPILANMYLNKVFDKWFKVEFPTLDFERYADDIIIHCYTEEQANYILDKSRQRFSDYKLDLHPVKTKIVLCKQSKHKGLKYPNNSFKFLGVQFRPMKVRNYKGEFFQSFMPVVPVSSTVKISNFIKELKLHRRTKIDIYQIAELINLRIQNWFNYFKDWGVEKNCANFFYKLNIKLLKWARNRYKRLKGKRNAVGLMREIQRQMPDLFVHWKYGFIIRAYK